MTARLTWAGGGEARVVSIDAKAVTLESTVPSPPGSRIEGVLDGEPPARLKVKIHACRKRPEGDFLLEGRPIDLTREVRERIDAAKG
jgi:hypothetical protein